MGRFLKAYLLPLLASVFVATVLGVFLQTQRVIAMLPETPERISISDRLAGYDIFHLGSLYGIFIFIGVFIAMTAAALLHRKLPGLKGALYIGAGAIALLVLQFAMKKAFFDVHIIAGARDALGISLQMLAGAFGGFVFWRLRQKAA